MPIVRMGEGGVVCVPSGGFPTGPGTPGFNFDGSNGGGGGFDPITLAPIWWLDAADTPTVIVSGSNVTQWTDKSGAHHNFTTNLGAARKPVLTADIINGNDAIRFSGGGDYLENATFLPIVAGTPFDLSVVYKLENVISAGVIDANDRPKLVSLPGPALAGRMFLQITQDVNQGPFGVIDDSVATFHAGTAPAAYDNTGPHVMRLVYNGGAITSLASYALYWDGASLPLTSIVVGAFLAGNAMLGGVNFSDQACLDGYLCEVFMAGALTLAQATSLQSYLQVKWDTP